MDEQTLLGIAGQRGAKHEGPQRLGDALVELMARNVAPRRTKFGQVAAAWEQLLPAELLNNCKIAGVQGGRLKVLAKSSAHLFELRLCSSELIKELAVCCPRAKIERIDITVG
jgi:hypothetical protein